MLLRLEKVPRSTQAESQILAERVVSMYRHNEYQGDLVRDPEIM